VRHRIRTGIVDQDVDAACAAFDRFDGDNDRGIVGQVELEQGRAGGGEGGHAVEAAGAGEDLVTGGEQRAGRGFADPGGCARDESCLVHAPLQKRTGMRYNRGPKSMVKALPEGVMLISEFARATGLSRDTIRFYVRRGLLRPLAGNKGGSNPYQVFTNEHVQMARTIRMAQSLGFSLREIAALNAEYQAKRITASRGAEILRWQLVRLEEKAAQVNAMMRYIRAKLAWLEAGSKGPELNFTDYENRSLAAAEAARP